MPVATQSRSVATRGSIAGTFSFWSRSSIAAFVRRPDVPGHRRWQWNRQGLAAGLVAAGASVMIVGRNPDRLAGAVEDRTRCKANGGSIHYEPADITNEEEATRGVEAVAAWLASCTAWCIAPAAPGPSCRHWVDSICSPVHNRSECKRHHVRAQALRSQDGAWRRLVRRHLVDRGQRYPPLVGAYGVGKWRWTT